jgi:hypothetical protein
MVFYNFVLKILLSCSKGNSLKNTVRLHMRSILSPIFCPLYRGNGRNNANCSRSLCIYLSLSLSLSIRRNYPDVDKIPFFYNLTQFHESRLTTQACQMQILENADFQK